MKLRLLLYKFLCKLIFRKNNLSLISNSCPTIRDELLKYNKNTINGSIEQLTCILSALIYMWEDIEYINTICDNLDIKNYYINNCSDDSNEDLVFGLFKKNNDLIIVFKGSTTYEDYITNLKFIQVDDEFDIPGKMHKGYYEILFKSNNYKKILHEMNKFSFNNIYVTGHSLGGALSIVFYSFLIVFNKHNRLNINNLKLINFGAPIVGDREFASHIKGKRYVNNNDLVPKIAIPLFYKQIEYEILLGKRCIFKWSRADHSIVNYLNNLAL